MKTRTHVGHDKADHVFNKANDMGMYFIKREYGSTIEIDFTRDHNIRNKYIDRIVKGSGHHISYMVSREVKKRIENGEYVPKNTDNTREKINTVCFNLDAIKANLNQQCYAVDMRRCYWDTSKIITLISERTWKLGMKKDKPWKLARNAAIGSLGIMVTEKVYDKGKLIHSEPPKRRELNVCRLDVIDYVWDFATAVMHELKDDCLMYLTDCFFVNKAGKKKVIELIEGSGYECKNDKVVFKTVERRNIDRGVFNVIWTENKEPNKPKNQYFSEKNIYKSNELIVTDISEYIHTENSDITNRKLRYDSYNVSENGEYENKVAIFYDIRTRKKIAFNYSKLFIACKLNQKSTYQITLDNNGYPSKIIVDDKKEYYKRFSNAIWLKEGITHTILTDYFRGDVRKQVFTFNIIVSGQPIAIIKAKSSSMKYAWNSFKKTWAIDPEFLPYKDKMTIDIEDEKNDIKKSYNL